jgi:hypothetical protein
VSRDAIIVVVVYCMVRSSWSLQLSDVIIVDVANP